MTYCVVPADTNPTVVAALRLQYQTEPSVTVIVDEREGEAQPSAETLKQRRPALRWDLPDNTVPGARFEQHMPPVDLSLAELPDIEIIARSVRNDAAASTELRWRCYARVLVLLTVRLGNRAVAHELVPGVMDAMQRALPSYVPPADFSRWLSNFIAETSLGVDPVPPQAARVLHCDDSGGVRALVSAMLRPHPGVDVIEQVDSHASLVTRAAVLQPDLVVLDLDAERDEQVVTNLREACSARIIFLSASPALDRDPLVAQADGFISKSAGPTAITRSVIQAAAQCAPVPAAA